MANARLLKSLLKESTKKEEAKNYLKPLFRRGEVEQDEVIPTMMKRLGIANNTAVTYFHMIAKELGVKGDGKHKNRMGGGATEGDSPSKKSDDNEDEGGQYGDGFDKIGDYDTDEDGNVLAEPTDLDNDEFVKNDEPDRQGIIRVIQDAKLVYKRENSQGLYDELWVYNIGTKLDRETDIKQNILAGTDIPPKKTESPNGEQSYTLTTIGNAQLLHITNLSQ